MPNDYTAVPAQMRDEPRWLCYQLDDDPKHPEKPRKTPKQARRRGVNASSTDPQTWASFEEAVDAVALIPAYAGIGFALGDGWVGVDFDHCVDEHGHLGSALLDTRSGRRIAVMSEVERLASYAELSPSGTGVHVIVRGALPPGRRKVADVEMYDRGRYFTVTGRRLGGAPPSVEERSGELRALHAKILPPATAPVSPTGRRGLAVPLSALLYDDAALLERARAASNGARFAALYAGEASAYSSASEADLALCSHLAFWCDGDADRVDRLFRASGLFREKWDERRGEHTYGERTTRTALAGRRAPILLLPGAAFVAAPIAASTWDDVL